MELKDSVFIVTGAAGGIGQAVTRHLIDAGARVGAIDRVPASFGDRSLFVECDVRDPAEVASAVSEIARWGGRLDGVVNNAAILRDGALVRLTRAGIEKLDLESWNDTLQTNLTGTLLVAREAVPRMIESKARGVIVNLSSVSRKGNAGQSAYAATKAAVDALTRTWAEELAFFKIRVVAVAPGLIDTPMARSIPKDRLDRYQRRTPAGRIGAPDEIAKMVLAIATNDYVNATTIEVDGGFTF
ncbi:MAG: SDR family oxidoreductase [Labilithrix sp.]|nr:SDR family oxidoreductase [Labilithrix sp.]MBX3219412.1 SDR family oxidoreductase [Labilithrix sp.]